MKTQKRKILTGANGGQYYFSPSGKKVYLKVKKAAGCPVSSAVPVTQTVAASIPVKKLVNHIGILLDESGSMWHIKINALNALNAQIATIQQEAATQGQKTLLSVMKFNSAFNHLVMNSPVEMVHPISVDQYRPNNQTALMDATGQAIEHLVQHRVDPSEDVSYLLIVITDGEENDSRHYSTSMISKLIHDKQATDRWSFVFSVPRGASGNIRYYLGVPDGNIQEWDQTAAGVFSLSNQISIGTRDYYQARSVGKTSTKKFFVTTDLSKVSDKDIKAMQILNTQFRKLPVLKEADIRPFVEGHGFTFEKGRGFYELTKPEDVQDYKEILIMDKTTGKLYGGPEARQLLGMPTVGTTRLKPGNHMNYSIFVKSTSVNRILVRGTTLFYKIV